MPEPKDTAALVAQVTAAYLASHKIEAGEIPNFMRNIHAALVEVSEARVASVLSSKPAVPISESITPDYLISLEDGQKFKFLKRHLRKIGLSPQEYRAKWGLPSNYPMVAPNYGKRRSGIAKKQGFGLTEASIAKRTLAYEQAHIAVSTLYSIVDGVVCTDRMGAITFMNPVAERLTAWNARQASGKPIDEILLLKDRATDTRLRPAQQCIDEEKGFAVEVGTVLLGQGGERFDVGFSVGPIRTPAGDIVGSVMVINDLTKAAHARVEKKALRLSTTKIPRSSFSRRSKPYHVIKPDCNSLWRE
jgi:PAS domain S-box-containing protein